MGSLFLHIRKPFTRELDLAEIGKDVTHQWHKGLTDSLAWRQAHPESEDRFLDIDYRELVADPLASAEKILAFAEVSFDDQARQKLSAYIANNPKGKHGTHRYSLDQFGLDERELTELFSEYNSHFSL